MNRRDTSVFGNPVNSSIRHGLRIYGLSVFFGLFASVQWICIECFSDWNRNKMPQIRYGLWIMGTFFGISILSCTAIGRKTPCNIVLIMVIVESSTLYIALEQQNTKGILVNTFAALIVITIVIASIVYGAYFPMRIVPGDLMLSLLVCLGNIMMCIFFLNVYVINSSELFAVIRNYFAFVAINMIMYTATIIHDRQFYVPKNEYIFLSVLIFFGHMIIHERVLAFVLNDSKVMDCNAFI